MGFVSYPAKGLLKGQRGLNLVDYLLNIGPDSMLKARNLYFFRKTVRRRHGFTRFSTEDWSATTWRSAFEFLDNYGNARLLTFRDSGNLDEIQSAGTHTTVKGGLGTGREGRLAAGFGSAFLVTGDDPLQRIDAVADPATPVTVRIAGVPAKPSLVVTAGAAGGETGDYAFTVTAVMEDGLGDKLLESDWADLQQITLTNTKQSGTITPAAPADARVTHYYVYRTDASGAQPKFFTKVAAGAPAAPVTFTDVSMDDLLLGDFAPLRGQNVQPPAKPELVAICGSRMVLAIGNTLYISPRSLNAYDVEAFPTQLQVPSPGPIKAIYPIPNTGGTQGTNGLLILKETSCHVLSNTDPTNPIVTLSPEIGIINASAIATRGKGIFWVDRKRGIMWWPGVAQSILVVGDRMYGVGDRILSVITGQGYQGIPANIGDGNVSLAVWDDKLLLTVRDDSAKTCANKVYQMNLLLFEQMQATVGPEEAAAWLGPWDGPGFYRFLPRYDGSLLLLDNENRTLSQWDLTTYKDTIGGAPVGARPAVRLGTCLAEVLQINKRIHQAYLVAYSNADSLLRLIGEESRFDIPDISLSASAYGDIPFEDIAAVDIGVAGQAWKSEGEIDWSAVAEWFLPEYYTVDDDNDWIWVGAKFTYTRIPITRTYV